MIILCKVGAFHLATYCVEFSVDHEGLSERLLKLGSVGLAKLQQPRAVHLL